MSLGLTCVDHLRRHSRYRKHNSSSIEADRCHTSGCQSVSQSIAPRNALLHRCSVRGLSATVVATTRVGIAMPKTPRFAITLIFRFLQARQAADE